MVDIFPQYEDYIIVNYCQNCGREYTYAYSCTDTCEHCGCRMVPKINTFLTTAPFTSRVWYMESMKIFEKELFNDL